MKANFPRIERLPPYVFNIVNELKAEVRNRGEDIIDFGMGNPERPAPPHVVDKLVEAAQRKDTHRYSASRGIPRLRRSICRWYRRRFDVALDSDRAAIVTIGSKEGLAHLALATVGQGDVVLVPNPTYPIHPYLDYGLFTPIQVAAIAALEGPTDCVDEIRETYRSRRDVLCEGLSAAGWAVDKPRATMFVWAQIPTRYREMGSLEFSKRLRAHSGVAVREMADSAS